MSRGFGQGEVTHWRMGCGLVGGGSLLVMGRNFAHTQDNIRDQLRPCCGMKFRQQGWLQEGELLQPHRVSHNKVQFLEANLVWPSMRSDRLSNDVAPLVLKTEFHKSRLKAEAFCQP